MHIKLNVKRKFYEFTKPGLAKNWTRKWIWYINNYAIQYNVDVLSLILNLFDFDVTIVFTCNSLLMIVASNARPMVFLRRPHIMTLSSNISAWVNVNMQL